MVLKGAHRGAAAGGAGTRGVPAVFRGLQMEGEEDRTGGQHEDRR